MSTISGVSHPHIQIVKKLATTADQAVAIIPVAATPLAAGTSNSQLDGPTSSSDENVNEAFAKLKVALTNLDSQSVTNDTSTIQSAGSSIASSAGASSGTEKTAGEQFKEYMDMPVGEKVRAGMLADMGITQAQYDAMTPEQQAGIDKKIEEKLRQDQEAKVAEHAASEGAGVSAPSTLASSLSGHGATGSGSQHDAEREKRTEKIASLS